MKYTNKKCKCGSCLMTKIGFDFHCNKCGGVVVAYDQDFEDTPDVDLINDLRAELDEEARLENEELKQADDFKDCDCPHFEETL